MTDDDMRRMLAGSRPYSLVVLQDGPEAGGPGADAVLWEHGRRNFQLRAEGRLAVVCPVPDDTALAGVGIFTGSPEEVGRLLDEDPAVRAGVLTYAVHPCFGFPGDALPDPAA